MQPSDIDDDKRQILVKNSIKLTVIWTLNCLVFARMNIAIKKNNRQLESADEQWSILVLAALFLLTKLIETEQGKDAYILFLSVLFIFLNFIE